VIYNAFAEKQTFQVRKNRHEGGDRGTKRKGVLKPHHTEPRRKGSDYLIPKNKEERKAG